VTKLAEGKFNMITKEVANRIPTSFRKKL